MLAIVEKVCEHFIFARFEPYIESGKHLTKKIMVLFSLITS